MLCCCAMPCAYTVVQCSFIWLTKENVWPVITRNRHWLPEKLTHRIERQTQKESVYTSCYHCIIPGSQLLQSMCHSDNVALPCRWIIHPLPHCFGAISLKLNMIVCTCSMSRQPFPNKNSNPVNSGWFRWQPTHPQTPQTQTWENGKWKIVANPVWTSA